MSVSIIATAVFFAVVTVWKFDQFDARFTRQRPPSEAIAWTADIKPGNFDEQMQLASAQAAYALERDVVSRRYDQASLTFATRLWTRFMGFMTGMILAFVGAAFVLGKLDMDRSELGATTGALSLTLKSASPGVMLATLGTVLMGLAIAIPATTSTYEGAVYFGPSVGGVVQRAPEQSDPPTSSAEPSQSEPLLKDPKRKEE